MGYKEGIKAENFFRSEMNRLGLKFVNDDIWYDFTVNYNHRVEVKGCSPSVKQGKYWRSGRFDFTKKFNRKIQYDENVWICFIIGHNDSHMMLGFCRAKQLEKKRYISLGNTGKLKLKSLSDWVKEVSL